MEISQDLSDGSDGKLAGTRQRPRLTDVLARRPVFAFSADLDWASEPCVSLLLERFAARGIVPTLFVTHHSPAAQAASAAGQAELALHPNFLPGSSHGVTPEQVLATVAGFAPGARGCRAHAYVDGTLIHRAVAARGLVYDSGPVLAWQPFLVPLALWVGLVRLPVFWEDDVHWLTGSSWDFGRWREAFLTPGLKIIDVHPFFQALNIPDETFYQAHKPLIPSLDRDTATRLRAAGPGAARFLDALFDLVREQQAMVLTLGEIADWAKVV